MCVKQKTSLNYIIIYNIHYNVLAKRNGFYALLEKDCNEQVVFAAEFRC